MAIGSVDPRRRSTETTSSHSPYSRLSMIPPKQNQPPKNGEDERASPTSPKLSSPQYVHHDTGRRRSTPLGRSSAAVVAALVLLVHVPPVAAHARREGLVSFLPRRQTSLFAAGRRSDEGTGAKLIGRGLCSDSRILRIQGVRGGAVEEDEDEEESEEYDDEGDNEEEEEEEESDAEDNEDEQIAESSSASGGGGGKAVTAARAYDEPLVPSPMLNLYASLGVMLLSKKVDLMSPTMVRIARFSFIAYLLLLQAFVMYVRIQAKIANDQTVIELKNPLSSVLQSQLAGGMGGGNGLGGNGVVKSLAASFLSSTSTIVDYDLKQASGMQSGLVTNMAFMWFLHFKMGQVQPLLIQSITGLLNMVYSPLFQVYVMGRNLERPFANPAIQKTAAPEEEEEVSAEAESSTTQAIEPASDGDEEEEEEEGEEEAEENKEEVGDKEVVEEDSVDDEEQMAEEEGNDEAAGEDESDAGTNNEDGEATEGDAATEKDAGVEGDSVAEEPMSMDAGEVSTPSEQEVSTEPDSSGASNDAVHDDGSAGKRDDTDT